MALRKKKVAGPITTANYMEILRALHEKYTFGKEMDDKLATLLNNPLDRIPNYIDPHHRDVTTRNDWLCFGEINGYAVTIHHDPDASPQWRTRLRLGCRDVYSEADARKRWPRNVSTHSGRHRPHYAEFFTWVAEVCAHKGWKW